VVVDDYSRLEAADALNVFKATTKNMVQMKLHEVMVDDTEKGGYDGHVSSASDRLAKRTICVLTDTARAMLNSSGFPRFL